MLSYHMLQKQSFENLILEARNQIPLYSEEWTNFNPSEPAETTHGAYAFRVWRDHRM